MKQTCIVVPIYKTFKQLSSEELLSLNQLFCILGKNDIFFICGKSFEPFDYIQESKKTNNFPVIKKFQDHYFSGIAGYNNMMVSPNFYRKFKAYNFMLVYQLDAFVFRNDLDEWCNKNYDFIGAPWFEGWNNANHLSIILGVGNGGFSLRKIKTTLRLLSRFKQLKFFRNFWIKSKLNYLIPFFKLIKKYKSVFNIISLEKMQEFLDQENVNEDYIITQILANTFTDFKVAPYSEALKFSFEVNPSLLYKENGDKLPFGCHAWEKYEPDFWKNYIHSFKKFI